MSELPKGWIEDLLLNFIQYLPTGVPQFSGEKEYYSTGSIQNSSYIAEGRFTFEDKPSRANRLSQIGDVLQARMKGTDKSLIIKEKLDDKLFSTGFIQLRPFANTYSNELLYYFIKSKIFTDRKDELATGSTQEALTDAKAEELRILVPPLNEQKRIAEKLGKLLVKIDEAKARLEKIPLILKRFRQSVLNAAVTGELTKDWREKNRNVESSKRLLDKIKRERNSLIEKGIIKKSKFNESKEIEEIPYEIPENWAWCRFNTTTKLITDGKHGDCKNQKDSGYFFLSAKDIINGKLAYTEARQITYSDFIEVHKRTNLEPGDICLVNTGATVGKIAIAPSHEFTARTTFQKSVAIIKLIKPFLTSEYIAIFLNKEKENLLKVSGGSAVNNLLLSQIRDLLIALPPQEEQTEIVKRVEALFKRADEIEDRFKKAKAYVDKLTQSILAKAFRGELVHQDPNDEPAEKLLERVRAEKEKQNPKVKKSRVKNEFR